jgi:hypothetical protein
LGKFIVVVLLALPCAWFATAFGDSAWPPHFLIYVISPGTPIGLFMVGSFMKRPETLLDSLALLGYAVGFSLLTNTFLYGLLISKILDSANKARRLR